MRKATVAVDPAVEQLWGSMRLSRGHLQAFGVLGWVKQFRQKNAISWELTSFGKLIRGPINPEFPTESTIVDDIRERLVSSFATAIDPTSSSEEVRRILYDLVEEGILCRIPDDAGATKLALTAKGLFSDRMQRTLPSALRRLFFALREKGLMQRELTKAGEWIWNPTEAGSADRLRSTSEPAICVLVGLEMGRLVAAVISPEVRRWIDGYDEDED